MLHTGIAWDVERRFAAGCTSVTQLHSELLAEHAPVTYAMVRAHIATLRTAPSGTPPPAAVGAAGDRLVHPSPHGPE
ncbi:hypothetical protein [Streptomyces albicerus]|uniref:hypothetical protein n=1 Tax=Streptomyces albicerus TaxID=2569859 RepID=UPI001CEDF5CF|nr:hypothetical protein [Streptomyces albicerus]